jgi:hypothetical protein
MAGEAKTGDFMLSTATVMVGPLAKLMDLNPTEHSIGLVKNFQISSEPAYTELTQGVKNSLVASVLTSNVVRASMEAYEFTSKNLNFGLGLDGSGVVEQTASGTVDGAITGDGIIVALDVQTGEGASFTAGDYITIDINGDDNVVVRKVLSVATDTLTLTNAFATGQNIPDAAPVTKVNKIAVGSKEEQPYMASKVVGKLANGEQIVLLLPKLRIVRGFNLAFSSDDFGNLPFEFTIYDQIAADPFYTEFGGSTGESARIFRK